MASDYIECNDKNFQANSNNDINRVSVSGLSEDEVKSRVDRGLINTDSSVQTKSISKIVKDNLFTLFNFINFILAGAIIYTGSFKNLLFIGVVISNLIIGIIQEIR